MKDLVSVIEAASRSKKIILINIDVFNEIAPKDALLLDLNKESNHIDLLHDYLNKPIKFDSEFIFKKWSWNESSLKLKKLLLKKLPD